MSDHKQNDTELSSKTPDCKKNGDLLTKKTDPVVFEKDGQTITNSRDVAEFFGKQHKTVLRTIDKLECSEDYHRRNFAPVVSEAKRPDGSTIKVRTFDMTKDGFTFLVMGFTGKEAAKFKEQYIAQFNAMETALREQAAGALITRTDGISRMLAKKVTGIERGMSLIVQSLEEQDQAVVALADRVQNLLLGSNGRIAALEYVSVRELLEEGGAIQKGRGGLNRRIGSRMRTKALQQRPPVELRKCPHSGVWLFPRDFAAQYMRDEGRALVSDHNAKQSGQAVMQFGPRRKGRKPGMSVVSNHDGAGHPA
jgi:Rha family phage regulatory protein